ncbi:hypothetical protein, partial [Raoultella sp. T31]|uniref:hypothetical protein n=1 Tax=Raoultella sp. T31 TaxID=2054594 RepID=UPI00197DEA0F
PVALAPFAPRWRCAYRGYVGAVSGLIAWRIALRRACGTGAVLLPGGAGVVCSPVALRLPGLRGCGVW